jgi:hypothetical protein
LITHTIARGNLPCLTYEDLDNGVRMRDNSTFRKMILSFAMLAFAALPAYAADCSIKMVASVKTMRGPSDTMLVPLKILGDARYLLLDTGGFFSELTSQFVSEMALRTHHVGTLQYDISGKPLDQAAYADDVSLGQLQISSLQFMVAPSEVGAKKSNISGMLAPNMFSAYDLDLDFPGNKFQLMSQDHCPGQVVYWPHSAVAAVPMRVNDDKRVVFPVQLDGHTVQAMLDTGMPQTSLSLGVARTTFGVDVNGPDVEQATDKDTGTKVYRHHFKTLTFEGMTVNNPVIDLLPDSMRRNMLLNAFNESEQSGATGLQGQPVLFLGMSTLKSLHVYIAYKEQMLYITAGDGGRGGGASGR